MPEQPLSRSNASQPTVEEVVALQKRLNLPEVHVAWLGDTGFTLAHTDEERERGALYTCWLHLWLTERDRMPVGLPGYYVVTPNGVDVAQFDFSRLEIHA